MTVTFGDPISSANVPKSNVFGNATQAQLEELAHFQQRYKDERDKRLRPDGLRQYTNAAMSDKLHRFLEDPWVTSGTRVENPVADGGSVKVLILGAGAAGILQAVHCIKAKMTADDICIVDVAGGFGGAWYWNRYPGVACDTEAYCYMPMLEEMNHMPSRKFAPGEEFRRHYERIAAKYDLQRRAMWQTWSQDATWNSVAKHWVVKLIQKPKGGPVNSITIHAQYMIIAAGLQSIPKIPNLEGLESYQGHMFHTSRWDYGYTGGSPDVQQLWGLVGKRRTPARVHPKPNPLTDITNWKTEIADRPGWQVERNKNLNAFCTYDPKRPTIDKIQDSHTILVTFCANFGTPRNITPELTADWIEHLNLMDIPLLKSVHQKVDEVIKDPILAEKLKAWFPTWCKRSLL